MPDQERVRARLRQALEGEPPDPGLRQRVMAAVHLPPRRPAWGWTAAGLVAVLAAAVAAGLVAIRMVGQSAVRSDQSTSGPSLTMVSRPDFSCSLPISVGGSDALVGLPGGRVAVDSAGQRRPAGEVSYADDGWRTVPWTALAPNQQESAAVANQTGVAGQVQTISVLVDDFAGPGGQQVWSGAGNGVLLGWGSQGIYFERTAVPGEPASDSGVWVVNPDDPGSAHLVAPNPPPGSVFSRAGGDAVWEPQTGGPAPQVVRLDLRSGTSQVWYTAPVGERLSILGVDTRGHPVLSLQALPGAYPRGPAVPGAAVTPVPQVLLLTAPQAVTSLGAGADESFQPTSVFGDGHGLWLGGPGAIWLYRGGRLEKIATIPSGVFPGQAAAPVTIAGPCQ